MMTELLAALHTLLSETGLPLYMADCVPAGAAFPYFTLEGMPAAGGRSVLRLTVWCTGDTPHADRLTLCDALLTLVPAGGLRILLTGCAAVFTRADGAILCRREADCLGLSLPLALQVHPIARKEAD